MARTQKNFSDTFLKTDFQALHGGCRDRREKQRYLGLHHLQQGRTYTEVADMLLVRRQTVRAWQTMFEERGQCQDKGGGGRPSLLPPDKREAFTLAVEQMQKDRAGGRVMGRDIGKMLKEKYQADYHHNAVYTLLHRLKINWMTARPQHPEADVAAQEAFKKTSRRP